MSPPQDAGARLRLLREQYARQLPEKLASLRRAFAESEDKAALKALRRGAHGLAGSGTTFGYPRVSEAARSLEQLAAAALDEGRLLGEPEREAAAGLLDALGRAAAPGAAQPISATIPAPAAPELPRKLVYLVDDDTESAAELALQLGHFGYQVEVFARHEQLSEAAANPALAAVLMDVVFPDGDLAGAHAILKLRAAERLRVPVVFLSVRGDLRARLAATRAGSAGYFMKPVDVRALVGTLDDVTLQERRDPERVLIVEDLEPLAEHYAASLRGAGLLTRVTTDPMSILSHLHEFRPDLVLMDVYLPGCTGAELAGVIRQLEAYACVPIVFLSTEQDAGKQLAAMRLGGDDFLTKPISSEHLVAAVGARLRRYRALRASAARDGLTGLLNHAATKERLAVEIARAERENRAFCFAMIDVDHFKAINDARGHPAGDRVLKSLADLLRQRLRKTDAIGRLGGDELGVILLDAHAEDALRRLDDLRRAFSDVRQLSEGRELTATFSAGVAEYRVGEGVDELCVAADQALYRAKQAGRERVVLADEDGAARATPG